MAVKSVNAKGKEVAEEKIDLSLNDLLLRGRVSAPATVKELPSGDKVVEFRLIVSRLERDGVDTLEWKDAKDRTLPEK
jgi:single-strand DNA-binding protein